MPEMTDGRERIDRKMRYAWLSLEPTVYNMALLRGVKRLSPCDLRLFFCTPYLELPWSVDDRDGLIDPASFRRDIVIGRSHFNPPILARMLREKWDCVVIDGYFHWTMMAALAICQVRRIPFIIRGDSHDLHPRPRLKRWLKQCFIAPLVRGCAAAMGLGVLSQRYWQSLGVPASRTFVVPFTAHLDDSLDNEVVRAERRAAARRRFGISPQAVVGVCVGRMRDIKGLDILLDAVGLMPPDTRPKLILVGDGPQHGELVAQAKRLGLDVTFTGFVKHADLVTHYLAADFLVLPSRNEPWGIVVAEAMNCGLPVVLSDQVGSAYDLLDNERNGLMVPAGDVQAWRDALLKLVRNPELMLRMSEHSRYVIRQWRGNRAPLAFIDALKAAVPSAP